MTDDVGARSALSTAILFVCRLVLTQGCPAVPHLKILPNTDIPDGNADCIRRYCWCRPVITRNRTILASVSAKPGPIATVIHDHITEVAANLSPKTQFLVAHGVDGLLLPLVSGLISISLIHLVARKAQEFIDQNPDDLAVSELLGMLPPALETPAVATAYIMMAVR